MEKLKKMTDEEIIIFMREMEFLDNDKIEEVKEKKEILKSIGEKEKFIVGLSLPDRLESESYIEDIYFKTYDRIRREEMLKRKSRAKTIGDLIILVEFLTFEKLNLIYLLTDEEMREYERLAALEVYYDEIPF